MPHVILEHTDNITAQVKASSVLKRLHSAVVGSGLFSPDAVKTRRVSYDEVCWGEAGMPVEFAHVTVKILAGRTTEQKEALADTVFAVLMAALPDVPKLSVDIHDMVKETYRKT
ncbi:MAG: 5-carboxymethyl-2-hydroxymuconate Delta-isomerase [Hyphomicrobiales bacterium]|nr:5-carboxymethyl-2-hydroxymuconate Delta-isomerase [Rickettsiales bacterium]MCP5361662.1 5-carboxymethyl-2-hydroxymuconate Delta-isomerase [Hyphomicrobiales bacterium]